MTGHIPPVGFQHLFRPAEYYVVVQHLFGREHGAWFPYFHNCKTIQLHTSLGTAKAERRAAIDRWGEPERFAVAKLVPTGIEIVEQANQSTAPATTGERPTQGEQQ